MISICENLFNLITKDSIKKQIKNKIKKVKSSCNYLYHVVSILLVSEMMRV